MNTTKNNYSDRKQEAMEKMKLSRTISEWVTRNRKVFWKYEVSCFYKTYMLRVNNLPEPAEKDIQLSANNRLLSDQQRKQLCEVISKTCTKAKAFNASTIEVQIDYDNGSVIAEVL
jgi:hypothetical protein